MFQFFHQIAQKIEMLFSDSDIAEMSQYKNYSEMMNAKACHNMQDIILDFTFEETRRNNHFCKQIINHTIERFAREYKAYTPKQTWRPDMFWKTECAVCRKEFHNMKEKTTEYGFEDPTQADFTDRWEWYGDVCHKCDERYDIQRFYEFDEHRFIDFMHSLCEGETKAERDEIFKNYDDFPSDYTDSEEEEEEIPKCLQCDNDASKNKNYPDSEGGKYWTLCEKCYELDQDDY